MSWASMLSRKEELDSPHKTGGGEVQLPPLVRAMCRPEFYPYQPESVELKQTHISYVFIAGPFVFKIKKPVNFGFLDYSTLAKRQYFCGEEVRLNRRLAPKVYLDVVPILGERGLYRLCRPGEELKRSAISEYAVKMRRLPEDQMLASMLHEGKAGCPEIFAIAKRVSDFHASVSTEKASVYGSLGMIKKKWEDNLRGARRFIGQTVTEKDFRAIVKSSHRFLSDHAELFAERVRTGRVREGHGDLRAEHICLEDGIIIFDCIEFSEEHRYSDVASEIGFLAMDLDFLDYPELSQELILAYANLTRDDTLAPVLPFYQCYRAFVRGKVESLKSDEEEVPKQEKEKARAAAERYFRLAYRYIRGRVAPSLILVCGLVGTGKSTLARALGDRTGFRVVRSDVVRKQLGKVPLTAHTDQNYRKGLYRDDLTDQTYDAMLKEAERQLKGERGVIVDATFRDLKQRRKFLELAETMGVPILFVECRASEEEIAYRLKAREKTAEEISDADWDVYLRQRDEFMRLNEIPDRCRLVANTARPPEEALLQIERWLRRKNFGKS